MNSNFVNKHYHQLLLFSFLLILILRLINIEQKNLWFDEVFSWDLSQKSFLSIINGTAGDIHPPLFYFTLKIWMFFFGDSVSALRFLSVLFSFISSIIFYLILKKFVKERSLLVFSLLLYAVSPLNIFYSQEVRMLSMNLMLCLFSVYFFMKLIDIYQTRDFVFYILFTAAAVYTHYFSFLIIFTQIIIFLIKYFESKDKSFLKRQLFSFSLILFLYIPWVGTMVNQVTRGQPWRTPQTAIQLFNNTIAYFNDSFLSYYVYYLKSVPLPAVDIISFLLLLTTFVTTFLLWKKKGEDSSKFFLTLFFVVPFAVSVLISLRNSILLSRYLSILVPFLILTLVLFSTFIKRKNLSLIFLSFLLALSFTGTVINYSFDFKNNDYREITSYLETEFKSGDKLIVEPHFMGWYFKHHIKRNTSNLSSPQTIGWDYEMILDSIGKKNDLENIWIILDYSSLDNSRYGGIVPDMSALGYKLTHEKNFYPVPAKVCLFRFEK